MDRRHRSPGDVDFYRFEGMRTRGSGVIELEAALLDETGVRPIARAVEDVSRRLGMVVSLTDPGTHYLRLSKRGQDPDEEGATEDRPALWPAQRHAAVRPNTPQATE